MKVKINDSTMTVEFIHVLIVTQTMYILTLGLLPHHLRNCCVAGQIGSWMRHSSFQVFERKVSNTSTFWRFWRCTCNWWRTVRGYSIYNKQMHNIRLRKRGWLWWVTLLIIHEASIENNYIYPSPFSCSNSKTSRIHLWNLLTENVFPVHSSLPTFDDFYFFMLSTPVIFTSETPN